MTTRTRLPSPCEFGHTTQAMECPSCSQRLHGETEANMNPEWWKWFRKRYGKKTP